MLFGNRSFIGYYQNPIPDVNAFLEHTFNNDNFMFDLLMENSYEEDGNIILSEASIGDFIGKFFKAIKDAIVKFIKMIKDFITGAVAKLKSLFSKKKKEVEEKKKEIQEKKEEKEKEEKLPTSAAQIAAGGAVGAALAAAKTVEKKDTSTPKTSSTKTSSTTTKTTSTVASKPQSTTSSTKTTAGSGFSPAARKSAEKATQQKPVNSKPVNTTQSKSVTEKPKVSDVVVTNNKKVLYDVKWISYGSLCQDFVKLLNDTNIDVEVFDVLNLELDSIYASNPERHHIFGTMDSRYNKQLANSSVKRDETSLNYKYDIDDDDVEGYLFISNYEKKIEEIKEKQKQMYPEIIFGNNMSKYPFIASYFNKNIDGPAFRQDVQKFGSISDKDLVNTKYVYNEAKLDTAILNSLYKEEIRVLEEDTRNFDRWKGTIEKSLNAIIKNLENMEKQISKDISDSEKVTVDYTNIADLGLNNKIDRYNKALQQGNSKIYDNRTYQKLEDRVKEDQQKTTVPRKPLLDYLNTTKTFINDVLTSVSTLANTYPRIIAKGSNYIFGFNIQYFSLLF